MEMETLTPFTYWAQNDTFIFLKIELTDVKKSKVNITDKILKFDAIGTGVLGENRYNFTLEFYGLIIPEEYELYPKKMYLNFKIKKLQSKWWPRLLNVNKKPTWLKIDFEKWREEEDLDNIADDLEDEFINQDMINKSFNDFKNPDHISRIISFKLFY
ncbi:unnamed protein product [Gordionus sp. m RMFG-2023]